MARIGFTYDLKGDWQFDANDPQDANAELDKDETVEKIANALEAGGHEVVRIGNVRNLLNIVHRLDVDIVFNICEGHRGRNRESQVPVILEMHNIPFVGADGLSLSLTLDKVIAKKIFIAENILTPRFFSAHHTNDINQLNELSFPLIVKTRHEGSSKGIDENSVVHNSQELGKRIKYINEKYHQDALVEEFIQGQEFTVAVLGDEEPVAMPVVQTTIDGESDLSNLVYANRRIYDESVKYLCPAPISNDLATKIQDVAVRVFKAVECRDVGRVDFRVDNNENVYCLEINPLPSFDDEDVFSIFPAQFDSTFEETINCIIDFGLKRYGLIESIDNVFYNKQAVA